MSSKKADKKMEAQEAEIGLVGKGNSNFLKSLNMDNFSESSVFRF